MLLAALPAPIPAISVSSAGIPTNVYNFVTDANSNVFRVFGYQEGWAGAISAT